MNRDTPHSTGSAALFRSLDEDADNIVSASTIEACLTSSGLALEDPRLATLRQQLDDLGETPVDPTGFEALLESGGLLLSRAVRKDLVIPDFERFADRMRSIFCDVRETTDGNVASYIPQLARVPADSFALAACTVDGQQLVAGDAGMGFTMQSSCKPLLYCAALEEHGEDKVHRHLGREPSGLSFNELTLNRDGVPHNPMINAGAIMTSSLLQRELATADRLEYLTDLVSALCGDEPCHFNSAVWHSERETADRNFALAHHMRERGAFPAGVEIAPTLDYFFSACSIEVNARNLATMGATFANGGVCPQTGRRIFARETVKNCLSMMYSCGMYDYSGEFAFTVGIPAKSSVSGVILAVIPNVMGIAIWSPRLDACGNSVRGVSFLQRMVEVFSFHNYDSLVESVRDDPRQRGHTRETESVYRAIYAASIGDVDELKRLVAHGHDLNAADYDGRTPLHLACAEGRIDAIRYLMAQKVNVECRDRWGNSPLADAKRHEQAEVVELFAVGEPANGRTSRADTKAA